MRRARIDQRLNVGEGVEQEVGCDLRLEQVQARVERLPFELTALERKRQGLIACDGLLLTNDRGQRRPWRDEEREEREIEEAAQSVRCIPERRCASRRG